jgi:hypothetical protein
MFSVTREARWLIARGADHLEILRIMAATLETCKKFLGQAHGETLFTIPTHEITELDYFEGCLNYCVLQLETGARGTIEKNYWRMSKDEIDATQKIIHRIEQINKKEFTV